MISVIVPVYNVEKYIINCLDSIVKQDYTDFELIIVNDGSKDNSVNLAREYLDNYSINWRIINKSNGGLASARNAGIKESKGEYIAFVDADDALSTCFLSKMLNSINKDNYDFVFCNFEFVKEQISPIDYNEKEIEYTKKSLLNTFLKRTINFVVPSMFFRKEFLIDNNLFFDEEIKFSEDQPFIWNVILHSQKSLYLYRKMYGYYIRENSIMTSSSYDKIVNSFKEYSQYINNLIIDNKEYKELLDVVLPRWELGTLFTASKLVDYDNYLKLYKMMDGRNILNKIITIKEAKAYLLALVAKLSPKMLYLLCRKMNLNG